jgi:hypothetical protein
MRRAECLVALVLLLALTPVRAAPAVLDDYARVLPLLQAPQRALLLRRAATWSGWTAAERADFAARAAAWDALAPAQRGERRERYRAWQALPVDERARVRAAMRGYELLPPAQQQILRAQFETLDRSDRRGWLLGPSLGAVYPSLQPLLAQLPPADHDTLLRVLRAMTPQQRLDLAVLVQRTPPQDRDSLRRALLSTSAANRQQWLWLQLER